MVAYSGVDLCWFHWAFSKCVCYFSLNRDILRVVWTPFRHVKVSLFDCVSAFHIVHVIEQSRVNPISPILAFAQIRMKIVSFPNYFTVLCTLCKSIYIFFCWFLLLFSNESIKTFTFWFWNTCWKIEITLYVDNMV